MNDVTHWCEKYRPRQIAECVLLPDVKDRFRAFVARGYCPHLLLVGPPGTGKTCLAQRIDKVAAQNGLTKSEVIRMFLEYAVTALSEEVA